MSNDKVKLKLNDNRIRRYREKREFLEKYTSNLTNWIKGVDIGRFITELPLKEKFSIYHAYQLIIEIISDVCAMIVKDLKKLPKDDYTNFNILEERLIIPSDLTSYLKQANGLRNRIVHDYNGIDDEIAFSGILKHLPYIKKFIEIFKLWLKTNS